MIISVVGARPQFVKAAVVSKALKDYGIEEWIVHTGQHYDDAMSGAIIRELGIENVKAQFACGTGTHAVQTAKMMIEFEQFLMQLERPPKFVLVFGDTNSTLAAALVAAKLHIPVVHVEAGLRSFNRSMPEEVNRVVVDHLSSLLFCSSEEGVGQLGKEGIVEGVFNVGDVMLDAFQYFSKSARREEGLGNSFVPKESFGLATIHRPSNTDNDKQLRRIVENFEALKLPVLWPLHPRLKDRIKSLTIPANVLISGPLSYLQMLDALHRCSFVVTDSGGLQKEAYWARKKCVTIRQETEWTETLAGNWNSLVDLEKESLSDFVSVQPTTEWELLYGDGCAARKIAETLSKYVA